MDGRRKQHDARCLAALAGLSAVGRYTAAVHWSLQILASSVLPALGWMAWRPARRLLPEAPAPTSLALGFALVLAWSQLGGMAAGFLGWLSAPWVIGWAVLGVATAIVAGRGAQPTRLEPGWLVLALPAVLLLLFATVPDWYRDSLTYHAALPRHFAQAGGYAPTDENLFASFPLGWESILAQLCALGAAPDRYPPFELRLVGAWATLAGALATGGLATALGVASGRAWVAGLLWLAVPTVFEFGASSYVEPWLVLLATLALTAALLGRAPLAGGLAGLAASVKYPGLGVALFVGLVLVADALRRPDERAALAKVPGYAIVAALLACPFYVRNLLERGNPVFPLAWVLFGGAGWDDWRAMAYGVTLDNYGLGRAPLDWLLLPLRLFTTTDFKDGFEGSLGPVVGLGVVGGVWIALRERRAAQCLLFVALWSLFWASSVQQVRFYLVAVPPILALGLAAIARCRRTRLVMGGMVALSLVWAVPQVSTLWRGQQTGDWLAGRLDREGLLSRQLPETYVPLRALEAHVPEDGRVWLVWTRGFTYYLRRDHRLDSVFEGWRFEALLDEASSVDAAVASLQRDGITHVLINHRYFLLGKNADLTEGRTERLRARFEVLLRERRLVEVERWGPVALYQVPG